MALIGSFHQSDVTFETLERERLNPSTNTGPNPLEPQALMAEPVAISRYTEARRLLMMVRRRVRN